MGRNLRKYPAVEQQTLATPLHPLVSSARRSCCCIGLVLVYPLLVAQYRLAGAIRGHPLGHGAPDGERCDGSHLGLGAGDRVGTGTRGGERSRRLNRSNSTILC